MKTKVKFLLERDEPKFVFAFFPDGKEKNNYFGCYSHIGQHSTSSLEYAKDCKEATPDQYADLKAELESIGYSLEIINGQSMKTQHTKGPWKVMSDELKDSICLRLSEIFGGREATRNAIYNHLKNERRQHWALGRVVIEHYKNANPEYYQLHYIAGQDMSYECKQIRNDLK